MAERLHMKDLVKKIKEIEQFVCENFEDLEMEDPIEEGLYNEYTLIQGASDGLLTRLEEKFDIRMPGDMKELYCYKNGSRCLYLLFPDDKCGREFKYRLLSLEEIEKRKEYFQNRNALLTEFYSYDEGDFTKRLLERMKDSRVKPYLWNERWLPFAEAAGDVCLMMDFDPGDDGVYGQIICFIHDPDEIAYTAKSISEVIDDTLINITFGEE